MPRRAHCTATSAWRSLAQPTTRTTPRSFRAPKAAPGAETTTAAAAAAATATDGGDDAARAAVAAGASVGALALLGAAAAVALRSGALARALGRGPGLLRAASPTADAQERRALLQKLEAHGGAAQQREA